MVQKDFHVEEDYEKGFLLTELFPLNNVGVVTGKDSILINENKNLLKESVLENFNIEYDTKHIANINYRLFDKRYIYYSPKIIERSREKVMRHFLFRKNIGLTLCKQFKSGESYQHVFISAEIIESSFVSNKTSEITSIFPLYLHQEQGNQISLDKKQNRTPNLNMEIVNKIAIGAGYYFQAEEPTGDETVETKQFYPIDILDYIYAVLHSPSYREKYKEFLKIDFPRVPYPTLNTFMPLVGLGKQLRKLHLLESQDTEKYITQYPIDGNNEVVKPIFVCHPEQSQGSKAHIQAPGKVYINETQYFDNVPGAAWNFYIGSYQPAQKWLKDRKGTVLDFEDILHYQKIIVALTRTSELMVEIDKMIELI